MKTNISQSHSHGVIIINQVSTPTTDTNQSTGFPCCISHTARSFFSRRLLSIPLLPSIFRFRYTTYILPSHSHFILKFKLLNWCVFYVRLPASYRTELNFTLNDDDDVVVPYQSRFHLPCVCVFMCLEAKQPYQSIILSEKWTKFCCHFICISIPYISTSSY